MNWYVDAAEQALAQQLWAQALAVQARAHAPYSGFLVGVALVDDLGATHAGCNVENAAYPQGMCAEAGAISAMVAGGGRHIRGLLVVGTGAQWVTPCGRYRQKIREFAAPHTPVWVANGQCIQARLTLDELLPHSFGPDHLNAETPVPKDPA
jgi:cytidine deaminase